MDRKTIWVQDEIDIPTDMGHSISKSKTGVLSDDQIRWAHENGYIVIHNPDRPGILEENLQPCSYDITLGENYYRARNFDGVLNPWDSKSVVEYWGECNKAEVADEEAAVKYHVTPGTKYILLNPGDHILAHTNEYIGGVNNITTMMKARSSMGRCNVTICRDAGWGDVGYISRWTMEITNNNKCPVVLPVGKRVGQIVFMWTGSVSNSYSGSYQKEKKLESIISEWSPETMLPKLA